MIQLYYFISSYLVPESTVGVMCTPVFVTQIVMCSAQYNLAEGSPREKDQMLNQKVLFNQLQEGERGFDVLVFTHAQA